MADVICNTSPLQYLHQLDLLSVLPTLVNSVSVPPAVIDELDQGKRLGVDLPDVAGMDWVTVRTPSAASALPLVHDLGPGETEVLMLALESQEPIVILDDRLARQTATMLEIPVKGTIGLLLDAKKAGLIEAVRPHLERLDALRFRIAPQTRAAVLELAGES